MIQLGHLELDRNGWTEQLCTAWFDQHRPYPAEENEKKVIKKKIKNKLSLKGKKEHEPFKMNTNFHVFVI